MLKYAPLIVLALLGACTKTEPCKDDSMALVMAEQFIKQRLKAPATASFGSVGDEGVSVVQITDKEKHCAFRVITYVDAQNSFGAKIREKFVVELRPEEEDNWHLIELTPLSGI